MCDPVLANGGVAGGPGRGFRTRRGRQPANEVFEGFTPLEGAVLQGISSVSIFRLRDLPLI